MRNLYRSKKGSWKQSMARRSTDEARLVQTHPQAMEGMVVPSMSCTVRMMSVSAVFVGVFEAARRSDSCGQRRKTILLMGRSSRDHSRWPEFYAEHDILIGTTVYHIAKYPKKAI